MDTEGFHCPRHGERVVAVFTQREKNTRNCPSRLKARGQHVAMDDGVQVLLKKPKCNQKDRRLITCPTLDRKEKKKTTHRVRVRGESLSRECGTYKTVKARFWLQGKGPYKKIKVLPLRYTLHLRPYTLYPTLSLFLSLSLALLTALSPSTLNPKRTGLACGEKNTGNSSCGRLVNAIDAHA